MTGRGEVRRRVEAVMRRRPVGEPVGSATIGAEVAADGGGPVSTGSLASALGALVRDGQVAKVSYGHYARAPQRRTRRTATGGPATVGDGEVWELLAVASDGAVLIRSTDGRVWRAVEV